MRDIVVMSMLSLVTLIGSFTLFGGLAHNHNKYVAFIALSLILLVEKNYKTSYICVLCFIMSLYSGFIYLIILYNLSSLIIVIKTTPRATTNFPISIMPSQVIRQRSFPII